ncbi:type IX secretion system ring subunit PorN/GldN [Salibacter halophilus]|uniref:Gliding motility protein GldN n=1 Tax=Salibacter halophilus TaxID=1803916 RepID=A0A6N6M774_9FLAO|nr:gliding motility protein GldN [Salibacter halophilus]KAB1062149.1 gliding motility protein GldN [Salibacter halophilus]
MKTVVSLLSLLAISLTGFSQVLDPGESPLDGVYSKSMHNANREPIPYVHLREADLMWLKRVWRMVDMEEKMNQVFYYPKDPAQGRKNFITILMEAITESGNITAYAAEDESGNPNDMFTIPMTPEEIKEDVLSYSSTISITDPNTGQPMDSTVYTDIEYNQIKRFKIKEEVFFDKQRSVLEFRILGIAPMVPAYNSNGELVNVQEGFWVYFPEARRVLAQAEVYNRHNDVHRLTYDDIFMKRMFSSKIVKESNVYDRSLEQYLSPLDALLEAEKIEDKIFRFEHDLWSF